MGYRNPGLSGDMQPGIAEFTPASFDESSRAWRANKVSIGEGMFRYKKNAFGEPKAEPKPKPRRSARLAAKAQLKKKWFGNRKHAAPKHP